MLAKNVTKDDVLAAMATLERDTRPVTSAEIYGRLLEWIGPAKVFFGLFTVQAAWRYSSARMHRQLDDLKGNGMINTHLLLPKRIAGYSLTPLGRVRAKWLLEAAHGSL